MAPTCNNRAYVERFAQHCVGNLGDVCAVATLLPWTSGNVPDGVVAPADNGALDYSQLVRACQGKVALLVPAIFDVSDEDVAAHRILPLCTKIENVCVFICQLLPEGTKLTRQLNEELMARHDPLLATGADDVFLNPDPEPEALRRTIMLARTSWELHVRRMKMMLEYEPEPVKPEVTSQLQKQHRGLLWDSIPRALMPHFKLVDKSIVETGHSVDKYNLVRRMDTINGTVLEAKDDHDQRLAIKVIDKSKVCTPGELEGIYREFRFTSEVIKHPHVAACLCMLHSMTRVYLIFEYAGDRNLAEFVSNLPGQRMQQEDALHCFDQIALGLVHCHSKDVMHRCLSLEHIVLDPNKQDGQLHCRIVDFRSAMVTRGQTASRTVCGVLPYVAPEMCLGEPYLPRSVDCWSAGVIVLEIGGGLGSLAHSVGYEEEGDMALAARKIQRYFLTAGNHAKALAKIGAIKSQEILVKLEALLVPDPSMRRTMKQVAPQHLVDGYA